MKHRILNCTCLLDEFSFPAPPKQQIKIFFKSSAVDRRHRFDAVLDPTFHLDAIRILPQMATFTHVEKSKFSILLLTQEYQSTLLDHSRIIFNIGQ
jgi:hypothetical protein